MATYYVSAKHGNDTLNDGSYAKPFQSINKAISIGASNTIYILSGKYIEAFDTTLGTNNIIIGLGNVILDGTVFNSITIGIRAQTYRNINFKNYLNLFGTYSTGAHPFFYNCYIENIGNTGTAALVNTPYFDSCIINTNSAFLIGGYFKSNTVVGTSGQFSVYGDNSPYTVNDRINNIIVTKPTRFYDITSCKSGYWNFFSVPITIGAITKTYDGSAGNAISDLRNAAVTAFAGAASDYFPNCEAYNVATIPSFVSDNPQTKADFALHPDSPSAIANFITGKHIGGMPVGHQFDLSASTFGTNIVHTALPYTLDDVDNEIDADNTIETDTIDFGKIVLVENWGAGIIEAMRNGEYANIFTDKDNLNPVENTETLINNYVYTCETEALQVTDGSTTHDIAVGENFTVPATGTWTVVSTLGKMLRIITEYRPAIYVRSSKTESDLSLIPYLKFFISAVNGTTAMPPMANLDINGDPIYGDADSGFSYTGAARLAARYCQVKLILKTNNAKS